MLAEVEKRLARFGVTGPGRDWLIKCLHPAGEQVCSGIPDESATAVLRPEYRVQYTIPPSTSGSYDIMIWAAPGDVNAFFWATAPSPADFTLAGALTPVGAAAGCVTLQTSTDQNVVLDGLFLQAGVVPSPSNFSVRRASNVPVAFRHQYKSLTCDLVAAAVSDQGSVYAAQFPFMPTSETYGGVTTNTVTGLSNCARFPCVQLPASESQMSVMAPEFYMGEARDGVYLPLRLTGPQQAYATTGSWGQVLIGGLGATQCTVPLGAYPVGIPSFLTFAETAFGASTAPGNLPWPYAAALFSSTGGNCDTGYDATNIGVIIYRGLTGAGSGPFPASVMVKVIAGLEVIPSPLSPDRMFTKPAAPYDPRALEAYYALSLELRDAYPSSFNFLGSILSTIGGVAAKLWPTIKTIGGALIPAIDSLAGVKPAEEPRPEPARIQYESTSRGRVPEGRPSKKKKPKPKAQRKRRA